MTVGATGQRVVVQANGIALQTEDPSFKQTIDQKTLTELPLNGRQGNLADHFVRRICKRQRA